MCANHPHPEKLSEMNVHVTPPTRKTIVEIDKRNVSEYQPPLKSRDYAIYRICIHNKVMMLARKHFVFKRPTCTASPRRKHQFRIQHD
jgi:hypothetical protein